MNSSHAETPRERLIVFLSFFTSPACQAAYLPVLSEERLAYELCSVWFDRVFVPGMRYLESIKGDFDDAASRQFRLAFSEEEWKYIDRFHRFLELRIDMMPSSDKRNRRLPINNLWESIVRDATYLLELLEPDLKKRTYIERALEQGLLEGTYQPLPISRSC